MSRPSWARELKHQIEINVIGVDGSRPSWARELKRKVVEKPLEERSRAPRGRVN